MPDPAALPTVADPLLETEQLDEAAIHDLWRLYQGEWWTASRSLEETRRIVAGSSLVLGLIEPASGRLVGFSRVLTDGVIKALVMDVIIAPAQRGRGLGRAQVDRILHHPMIRDVAHVELVCRPELMPFYASWGFSSDFGGVGFMRLTRAATGAPTGAACEKSSEVVEQGRA